MVSLIAALSKNRVIGRSNDLPWTLTEDLEYFRATTNGHPIIMGGNTYRSVGKLLPGRTNIILTKGEIPAPGIKADSIQQACQLAVGHPGSEEIFVIGGATIYQQALEADLVDRLYLTEIDQEIDGDIFFPQFDYSNWQEISRKDRLINFGSIHFAYSFVVYDRLKA